MQGRPKHRFKTKNNIINNLVSQWHNYFRLFFCYVTVNSFNDLLENYYKSLLSNIYKTYTKILNFSHHNRCTVRYSYIYCLNGSCLPNVISLHVLILNLLHIYHIIAQCFHMSFAYCDIMHTRGIIIFYNKGILNNHNITN